MAKVTRFEDLKCWQKARELVRAVYTASGEGSLAKDYALRDQLRRAALSAMTNIAEGFARFHQKEFIRFLDIAQSSAVEVQSLLYVVDDLAYLAGPAMLPIRDLAKETEKLTLGLLRYLHRQHSASSTIREPETVYEEHEKTRPEYLALPDEYVNPIHPDA